MRPQRNYRLGRRLVQVFFFFQAEDGIRDKLVTGVQTCALPISPGGSTPRTRFAPTTVQCEGMSRVTTALAPTVAPRPMRTGPRILAPGPMQTLSSKIGRASCRERV